MEERRRVPRSTVAIALVVLILLMLFGGYIRNRRNASSATQQTQLLASDQFATPIGTLTTPMAYPTATGQPQPPITSEIQDVEYQSWYDFPEMLVAPGETVTCSLRNRDVVTFSNVGQQFAALRIVSTKSKVDVTVYFSGGRYTLESGASADGGTDRWVRINTAGRISVAYDSANNSWSTDWLRGCPIAKNTPDP